MVKLNSHAKPNSLVHAKAKMILLKEFRLVDECSENCENDRRSSLTLSFDP